MYKYIQKFPVNNILSNQLRYGSNSYLTLDKDLPFRLRPSDQIKCNYASISPSISDQFFRSWNTPPSSHYSTCQSFANANIGQPDILCKYYKLTQPRRSSCCTSSGRITKNSFKICTQNRGYASFFKRIVKLFKPKPSKPPKCDSVKPCPRRSDTKICAKPPPKIDFETAVKCKIEAINKESCENYMQHMCPKGIEVGYKEKPPFTSEGGQFLEDRLCREMPEKRVQKIEEEHAVKQQKLEDLAELKEIEEIEKRKLQKLMPEFKTSVKSTKKLNTSAQSDITLAPRKKDPCAKIESSIQCDLKTNLAKAAHPCSTVQKATSCTELAAEKSKKIDDIFEKLGSRDKRKGVCAKPCLDPAEIEDLNSGGSAKDPCKKLKPCAPPPGKIEDKTDPCRNIKPCSVAAPKEKETFKPCGAPKKTDDPCKSIEDKEDKTDPCRNIKPCSVAAPKEKEAFKPCGAPKKTDDPCKSNKGKNRCGMVVRPCGSKYKPLKPPRDTEKKDLDEDECGSVADLRPCIRVECKPIEKAKEDTCKKEDICRNVKPCASSKKAGKSDNRSKQMKSCLSQEKKSDSCRNIKPCASTKKSKDKSDPCAQIKPCGFSRKAEASDSCKQMKEKREKDTCGPVASMKKATQEEDDCGSVDNLPPCPRIDCGGSSKKDSKDPCKEEEEQSPCSAALTKKPSQECKGIQRDDCGESTNKDSKDPCKKEKEQSPCNAASLIKAIRECKVNAKGIQKDDCASVENPPACESSKKESKDPCKKEKDQRSCNAASMIKAIRGCKGIGKDKEQNPCGAAPMKKPSQECKGIEEDDCGSVENLPPCPRIDCGGSARKQLEDPCKKDKEQNPCGAAPMKKSSQECNGIEEDGCGSVENLPPCPRMDCGGSSKRDPCKIPEKSCENKAPETKPKMLTCSELKAKEEKLKPKTCEKQKKKDDDDCKKPPKPSGGGGCSPSPKGPPPSSLGRGIKSDIVKFYSMRDEVAGTPSEIDILTSVEKFKRNRHAHDSKSHLNGDVVTVGMNGEHRVEAHTNLFKQCRLLNSFYGSGQRGMTGDYGLNLGVSQLMGFLPRSTKFLCSQTLPNIINHCAFSTRVPKVIIQNKKPYNASQAQGHILQNRLSYPFNIQALFYSEAKGNGGDGKNDEKKPEEDPCNVDKKPCPVIPCCKLEKDKCVMSSEPPKFSKICRLAKPEEPKVEVKTEKPNPCNFEQAVKAESKHKNFKENMCPIAFQAVEVCPPKKQLCCYRKHEKPTMQGVDPCCRGVVGDVKALGCGFCKKFELLNTPPKTLPKPSICKAKACFSKAPKGCPPQKSPSDSCKSSVCKRSEIPKCPKPKFKVEVKVKPKKKPVGIMRCSNAPCYQKKCQKKKPPPPPCPTPIKPPKLEDLPPTKKPCKKVKKPVDENAKKMCIKAPKRRGDAAACNISACDKDKAKAKELAEKKRLAALTRQKAYADLKHTDWKAVPIKGDNRWCKSPPVEKNTKCDKELSKTVLPTKDEKYQSPRYSKKGGTPGKNSCVKPCPSKHVRKMHSCPHFDKREPYNVKSRASLIIRRDYFENLASIVSEKPSEVTSENTDA